MKKASGTNALTWTPNGPAPMPPRVSAPTPMVQRRNVPMPSRGGFNPAPRPGYELRGPYNSMEMAAAQGLPFKTREQLLADLGGTPIAPVQPMTSAGPQMPNMMGLNPAILAAIQARMAQGGAIGGPAGQQFMPQYGPMMGNAPSMNPLALLQARMAAGQMPQVTSAAGANGQSAK